MADRRYKVLFVCGHPVQYMSPLLRRMAQHPQLDVSTVYCRLRSALAALLRRALSDPQQLARLRAAAGERMKTWSPEEYIAAILKAVQHAVTRTRPTP